MVKKRIFFLVILHVALTLVSCANGEDVAAVEEPQPIQALDAPADDVIVLDEPEPLAAMPEESDIITIKKKRKKRVKKTTTAGPFVACENTDFIIESRKKEYDNIPEGYTAEECVFKIINKECEYRFECGTTITEAPLILIEETTEEPDEDASLEEDDDEECEPKKKIKFDNCFLKIRGLIKKKKPKRCD
jgi:hypothetical protein